MKRDEVINKIIETIRLSYGNDGQDNLCPPDEYLAEMILRTIEEAGMQPPKLRHYVLPDGNPEFAYMEWVNKWES